MTILSRPEPHDSLAVPSNDVSRLHSEREQTDESLRVERDRADRALDDEVSAADETADAVISRARARADALLAAARTKTDDALANHQPSDAVKTSRAVEDHILQRERLTADDVLREERAEHVSLLAHERATTDHDLTHERARADKALTMRDEFMGIVSHDLLNLLNATIGVSSLIEKEVAQDNHVERVVAHARRVQRSGARMRRLVGDMVDVASIEAGMLAVTRTIGDPADVVSEAVETFQAQASGSGVWLMAEIAPDVALVAFDAARILQVLCNLLSNALKFTPAQGTVRVRLEQIGDDVVCAVSDTGPGIPDDKLEAVFDRFVQLTKNDRRGVGLGLFISKCIVQGHGGRIWAENRSGEGSTFCFTLPVSAGDAMRLRAQDAAPAL
jgi:signal transduction histidine kinase